MTEAKAHPVCGPFSHRAAFRPIATRANRPSAMGGRTWRAAHTLVSARLALTAGSLLCAFMLLAALSLKVSAHC
jgi:hypothetical protein